MPSLFDLTYFDPPPQLARCILSLFHFSWDESEIVDRHPGALAQLVLFPRGSGEMTFDDRTDHVEGEAHMLAGFETASPFSMKGPWHAIGASLSPQGWAALTGRPVNEHVNRFMPASELLGPEIDAFALELNSAYRNGAVSGKDACFALAEWIEQRLGDVPEEHEDLMEATFAWLSTSLNPDVEELFSKLSYSRRQAERLVTRYFGFSPMALARKYRAVRAASLLAQPELTDEAEAEIAGAFYDQPHMIREIRRYCGYTPTRLGGEKEPIFQTMLRLKNLDRLKEFRKIG